uniref:SH3 and multiple ankyrin repeat domains 3 n=1 Tax=Bos indicus x Bos taurus TaxID=30522 RepID=A0A4W2FIR0_BOBOX
MKKFASSRSLNKILAQCDSSSREYEEVQAVGHRWHLRLATPRCLLLGRRSKAPLFFAAPPPPKRAPSTTLTLRSKSMTAELEELEKLDEILAAAAEPALRPDIADADSRAATVKQRPTSRRITPAEISSLFERQGLPGPEKLPGSLRKGIPRTKSVVVQPLHPRERAQPLALAFAAALASARPGPRGPQPAPALPTKAPATLEQVRRGRLAGEHPLGRTPRPLRGPRDRGRAPAGAHQGRLRGAGRHARGPPHEHRARAQAAGRQLTPPAPSPRPGRALRAGPPSAPGLRARPTPQPPPYRRPGQECCMNRPVRCRSETCPVHCLAPSQAVEPHPAHGQEGRGPWGAGAGGGRGRGAPA